MACKRGPRMFSDFAKGGCWTGSSYPGNESHFQKIKFRQCDGSVALQAQRSHRSITAILEENVTGARYVGLDAHRLTDHAFLSRELHARGLLRDPAP